MPTPIRYFRGIAKKWGEIDPDDQEAVENWFLKELPKLPKKDLNAILDELIEKDHHEPEKPEKLIYPEDVPLPRMKDILPASGFSWMVLYIRYAEFLKRLINTREK